MILFVSKYFFFFFFISLNVAAVVVAAAIAGVVVVYVVADLDASIPVTDYKALEKSAFKKSWFDIPHKRSIVYTIKYFIYMFSCISNPFISA